MEQVQDDAREALSHYFQEECWELERNMTGYSHVTIFVKTPNGSFALRIYQSHAPLDNIKQEHAYLEKLNSLKWLSFEFPRIHPSLKGETIVKLSNGLHATLFERIPGCCPDMMNLKHWTAMGRGTAEVLKAFDAITTEALPPMSASDMLYNFFTPLSRENFVKQTKCPPFVDEFKEEANLFLKEADLIEKSLESVKLPVRVIHGDLHAYNFLIFEDKVSGVVDLELTKPGWRVMDVAAAISNFGFTTDENSDIMGCIDAFASGFCEKGELTEEELKVIPLVLKMRYVSLFIACVDWYSKDKSEKVRFVCRMLLESVTKIIPAINKDSVRIVQAFASRMKNRSKKEK